MHPNATASVLTSAATALILYIAHRLGYAHLSSEDTVALTGSLIAAVLWIGRRGPWPAVLALWQWVLHGERQPPGSNP